ncbi:MAG: FAD-dependent monooxygenase [Legionella sp.]|nr:FAD-dependent monooxygenase [Legionella sp.]
MEKISLMGAGLAGSLCALYLAKRGYEVDLFESRTDLRNSPCDYGRSINLALSCRGITGLKAMDLMDEVKLIMVPMRARAIHDSNGKVQFQPFGRHENEYINAISRNELNALLLNKAEYTKRIHLHFEMKLKHVDIYNKKLHFDAPEGPREVSYYRLIAADGASSIVREQLIKEKLMIGQRDFLSHGYKELSISKMHSTNFVREHLHLWPRDSFLLLGNPNPDDSITGSLFLAYEGANSFSELDDEDKLTSFFKKEFPDAFQAMPNLIEEFFDNPTGTLSTIQCDPWFYRDECLLIGDAAHGVIPFLGQGMNCAFEDCRILDALLEQHQDDWSTVMPNFYEQRKKNTNAVAMMSIDNYHEIHSDIKSPQFILRKQVELALMHKYPELYVSKHVLVMFTNTSYVTAHAIGELQKQLLDEICKPIEALNQLDWSKVDKLMGNYGKNLAKHQTTLD